MNKLNEQQKMQIKNLSQDPDLSTAEIAKRVGVSYAQVNYLLKSATKKSSKKKTSKKVSAEALDDTQIDATDDSEMDWKAWAEKWKELYLVAHAQLIENNIVPE